MNTNKNYLEAYNLVFNWISEKNPEMNIDSISETAAQFAKLYFLFMVFDLEMKILPSLV